MDKTEIIRKVNEYASAVNREFGAAEIYLFGSYATGNFSIDSDIDIAVVFNEIENIFDIQLELMRLRRKIDSRIEPHPFRKSDFDRSNPIVNEILNHGQEIIVNVA
jgi:predicted nucleotidyltransferase